MISRPGSDDLGSLQLLLEPSHPSAEDQCALTERLPPKRSRRGFTYDLLGSDSDRDSDPTR